MAEFNRVATRDPQGQFGLQSLYRAAVTQSLFLGEHQDAVKKLLIFADEITDPDQASAAKRMAADILQEKLEQHDRARAIYENLLTKIDDPNKKREISEKIAKCFLLEGRFVEAEEAYEKLLETRSASSNSAALALSLAQAKFSRGLKDRTRMEQAGEAFKRVIVEWPDRPEAIEAKFLLASVLEEEELLPEAEKTLVELDGRYPSAQALKVKLSRVRERMRKRASLGSSKK